MMNSTDSEQKRLQEIALRRAIIAVKPDYFSLSENEQEHYRAVVPDAERLKLDQLLLESLFNIQADTKKSVNAVFKNFDEEEYLIYNSTILLITGIGDDYFFLNSGLPKDKNLLDYDTLYDYDEADHRYQEYARKRDFPDYKTKPYDGNLYFGWARLFMDGAFTYANLSMTSGYVYSQLESFGFEKMDHYIPHRYVKGPNHGKREGKGSLWDRKIDASGKEAHLDELKERYYRYKEERRGAIAQQFDDRARKCVYLFEEEHHGELNTHFVFTDKTALQAVRFRHFLKDCRTVIGENRKLDLLVDQERQGAQEFLEKNCQDILENFDPTVVKFKRKRKIILSDEALSDLI